MHAATEFLNVAVNGFDAKKSVCHHCALLQQNYEKVRIKVLQHDGRRARISDGFVCLLHF